MFPQLLSVPDWEALGDVGLASFRNRSRVELCMDEKSGSVRFEFPPKWYLFCESANKGLA